VIHRRVFMAITNIHNFITKETYFLIIKSQEIITYSNVDRGTTVAQWLIYCATNLKVSGLIPNGVIEFFH
jgi:hypothetical protein